MYKKIIIEETKYMQYKGYDVAQASNGHITVRKNGQLEFHINCTGMLNDEEVKDAVDLVLKARKNQNMRKQMNSNESKKPKCFLPENDNPYPLCIGQEKPECNKCQLRADWEPEDPYGVEK